MYFEDFHQGQIIELGQRSVTAEEIIEFARQFDPQYFHLDAEKAKDSIFGELVASGWHTASIYMRLLVDGLLNQAQGMGSPGIEELRWLKPVKPGDTLTAHYIVIEMRTSQSRPDLGIIKGRGEMANQQGEVVMTITSNGFFARKPA